MAKSRKNFYAIRLFDEKKDLIIDNWPQAKELTDRRPHILHGFATKEEAQKWLDSITPQEEARRIACAEKGMKAKKEKANYKKYSIQLPSDVAGVLDSLCSKWNKNASAILEDLIRTEYMSEE